MKVIKKVAIALFVLLIAMQFYRPSMNQAQGNHTAQFLTETNPPEKVKIILQQTCYDCHSNDTQYPWYNNIAPVSYWIANHIEDGKKHLNFSDWDSYTAKDKNDKLAEIIQVINDGEMPLKEYKCTHERAKITAEQRIAILNWAKQTSVLYQLNQRLE